MSDFFDRFYDSAVVRGTPYSEVWTHTDGRILGLINGVFHQLSAVPTGFSFERSHPLSEAVWIYKFQGE